MKRLSIYSIAVFGTIIPLFLSAADTMVPHRHTSPYARNNRNKNTATQRIKPVQSNPNQPAVEVVKVDAKKKGASQIATPALPKATANKQLVVNSEQPKKDTAGRILVNKVAAVIHGPERSRIFSTAEYKRRGIDGRQRPLADLIADELIYQDALRIKMPVDDTVVKAHLRKVTQSFGLKPGEEEAVFAQEGYSFQEGFEQFRTMYAVNAMTEHHIMQNLLISEDEVVAYYNAHPIVKEAAFLVETASVPYQDTSKEGRLHTSQLISEFLKTGKGIDVNWSDGYWVKKSELANDLKKLATDDIGTTLVLEESKGINLYRLLNKKTERTVPLAKRYKKIVEILRQPKFEELLTQYRQKLIDNATVVHLS